VAGLAEGDENKKGEEEAMSGSGTALTSGGRLSRHCLENPPPLW
jgi:hypothetical protein